jgi:hypothetical protein
MAMTLHEFVDGWWAVWKTSLEMYVNGLHLENCLKTGLCGLVPVHFFLHWFAVGRGADSDADQVDLGPLEISRQM